MTQPHAPATEVRVYPFRFRNRAGFAAVLIVAAVVCLLGVAPAPALRLWTQGGSDTIGRANLDGSGSRP